MRILYIDIDTLRPDHLGCYGYGRNTSPNIDALASQGVRFDHCYNTDAPCLPSRSALWSGRCGFHTGVVNHGGTAADPFIQGPERGFRDVYDATSWIAGLRRAGLYPVTVSPFGERHSAWWWYAGWREVYNPGKGGMEGADDITPYALDWIARNARRDNWFLHVNYWDPHTPYRAPESFGNPFENDPLPAWLTEGVRQRSWDGFGPHSAQEPYGYGVEEWDRQVTARYPRLPAQLDSMQAVKQWIDGYDTGIRYADEHVGRLLNALADQSVLDDLVIVVSSDHGENQGELNVWGDHQTADEITCRVPLIVRWPGLTTPRIDTGLYHQYDWAATMLELLGVGVPANWDGRSFTEAFKAGQDAGRPYLVVSQNAWSCQRGVRFRHDGDEYICLRTYHDGYKMLDPVMLFNLSIDPHEQHSLVDGRPELVNQAMAMLAEWQQDMMRTSTTNVDPLMTVLREGGAFHTRGNLPAYLAHLRATGRAHHAEHLARVHPDEV
ncbi:MAG: sulfatase [Anaerolineae bacterium]|nr:sulfatase [Anaerolineae bacterium]